MKSSDYVHLHCHSTYSLLEALPSPEEIVLRAKELKQTAVGLADKGYTYGLIEFYKVAKEHGLKAILGCEVYIAVRSRHDKDPKTDTKRYPLTLFAETQEGYQNLLELVTKAALEGMYYKPRVDSELLAQYGKGLMALSGPLGGAIPQAALIEDGARMRELVEQYRSFFGEKNLYFELMDLPEVTGQAEANQQLIRFGKELNVPLVATCNVHYVRREDAEAHDVLLCIQKNANVEDTHRFSMIESDYSMRPFEELERAFSHVPEALAATREIADRCNVGFEFGKYQIPAFTAPGGETEAVCLRKICEEGLKRRYGAKPKAEVRQRLDYELRIIEQMGFASYFLIVWDFVRFAKQQGITVGPGRGSAPGSIVSYCLDITTLDPLEHGLLFERFLNPERISMPDIDLDFADNRRDEVLSYVAQKYGRDHVVQICTFGTLAARAAVKDVGRAYGIPFVEMNELVKLIPERPGTQLREALRQSSELNVAYESNPLYRKIMDTALKLEGKARHVSVHACGVIITKEPTVRTTALQRAPKDDETIITQYDAKPLEDLGLIKMDFLGLKNLTIIQSTLEHIERLHESKIDLSNIPLDDKATFALLSRADTTGVFQLESEGMRRYLKQLKPTQFGDITAMVALFRPGPMEWIPEYIKRKHKQTKITYLHEDLKPILEPTYGIGVYQEQILQLARTFAGYTLGEADILRKAIGKKIKHELDAQEEKFITGAVKKGYPQVLARKIFDDVVTPFAGYGFPKAHAACYARIAYETAHLKAHYPTEFMAAMLSSEVGDSERVAFIIGECHAMGIDVLPPDINESFGKFTPIRLAPAELAQGKPIKGAIRFGLTAVKGVGDSSVEQIIALRDEGGKFASIEDFAKRLPSRLLNKKFIEALAKSGALDSLGERSIFVAHYERIADFSRASGNVAAGQGDLFATGEGVSSAGAIEFPETLPVPTTQKLQWEKETLGLYVSNHPLAGLRKYIGKKAMLIANFTREHIGKKVTVAGIVENVKKITTKKGDAMAIVFLEDPTGKIEITLFPRVFAQASEFLTAPDTVLVAGGTLDERAGQLQIRADAVKKASLPKMIERAKEEGFFDDVEARKGVHIGRVTLPEEPKVLEAVDEEGNVVAGEKVVVPEEGKNGEAKALVGSLAMFLGKGMPLEEPLGELNEIFQSDVVGEKFQIPNPPSDRTVIRAGNFPVRSGYRPGGQTNSNNQKPKTKNPSTLLPPSPSGFGRAGRAGEKRMSREDEDKMPQAAASGTPTIRIHTVELPARAPKQLLLELKTVFDRFPGKERIQFRIADQDIPLPMAVTMSTILEKKIEEVMQRYAAQVDS